MVNENMKKKMQAAVDAFKEELIGLRTGRAHPGLLERVSVDYYGSQTPLKQMANIVAPDSRTLMITPWDKSAKDVIIKAITVSDLGLTPVNVGEVIKVSIPTLTEERRLDLVKHLGAESEKTKVGIRNIRRQELSDLKAELKEKLISEDDERRSAAQIQKVTDEMVALVDQITQQKEKELMTV
ncbi:ribosome recycling factor [Candidatus Comchoanobacter bicostacola]|uniref:Ribosome-recycling factor n=1 Tax=Candidatus Comchoanobacter bicostacola TaxID=2919598 RepID=A0ABY5DJE3_9GAMM|nr:ribosome recycling factor [Candidatus Comchoanobacter bicostacola]UTC24660.1 ribosome recycling factor [Candidatus Comchoanobacter bicostacola]